MQSGMKAKENSFQEQSGLNVDKNFELGERGKTTYGQIVFSDKLSNNRSGQNCTSNFQKQSEMHSKKKIFKEQSGLSVKRKLWKWREGGSEMLKSSFKGKAQSIKPGRTCNTFFQKKHPGWNVNIIFQKSIRNESEQSIWRSERVEQGAKCLLIHSVNRMLQWSFEGDSLNSLRNSKQTGMCDFHRNMKATFALLPALA